MRPYFYLLFAILGASEFHQACAADKLGCSSPRLAQHAEIVWSSKNHDFMENYPEGTVVGFGCDAGYTLLGSGNTTCSSGEWLDHDTRCLLEVAEGNRCYMSSLADEFASAHVAADGDPHTCVAFSSNEKRLVWSIDTIQAFRVQVVTIFTLHPLPNNSTIEIRAGSRLPSTGSIFNEPCTRIKLDEVEGNEKHFHCENVAAEGRYISILITEPGDNPVSICEVKIYSDSGLSVDDGCPPKSLMLPETARYIFENQCVEFLGQNTHDKGVLSCELRGGRLVTPTSREFQSFLDYHVLKFFETSYEQMIVSFWVDYERKNGSDTWSDRSGTALRGVQIKSGSVGECLVSESRSWHAEPCRRQHQVICVSPPLTCGNPALPEHSSILRRAKIPVNESVLFSCDPGYDANVDAITCFSNGSLSEEPLCEARTGISLSFSSKISKFLRSFSIFAKLSAEAFRIVLLVLSGLFAALLSVLTACCFCIFQRKQAKKMFLLSRRFLKNSN